MDFIAETTSGSVSERLFILNGIPGVLWSPTDPGDSRPLVLVCHGGGQHKKAPGVVARAHRYVTACGFAVAAIDAPGHGDRPRSEPDERFAAELRQRMVADEPVGPLINRHNANLADSPTEDAIVAKFVRAYEAADLDALVALLTDDVFISMPPMPLEYEGRDVAARFFGRIFRSGRRFDLVPTRANGQPGFGAYLRAPTGIRHGIGLFVLTLTGDRICALTRFDNSVLSWFGLPRSLPSR